MESGRGDAWSGDAGPTITRVGGALVVTLPRELDDAAVGALRARVLEQVRRASVPVVVFEASGLDVVDATEFAALASVARAAGWLGARPMLVGLTPGLVRYLIDAEVDTSAFAPYGTLDDALAALAAEAAPSVTADAERNDGPSVPASEPEA